MEIKSIQQTQDISANTCEVEHQADQMITQNHSYTNDDPITNLQLYYDIIQVVFAARFGTTYAIKSTTKVWYNIRNNYTPRFGGTRKPYYLWDWLLR